MKFIKSMSKRTLALILALMMMLSSGIIGAVAANVELAPTGVNHTGGYIYFLKPSTWTESKVMMFIGKSEYTSVYEMTKVSNTENLYRYTCPTWGGATYVAFANASYVWGSGDWGPSNRTNAPHYTNVYNNYRFDSGSYYVCVPASTSNNAGLSINYKSSADNLNLTARADVYSTTADGTTYSSNAKAGTVSVSGFYMSAYDTASTRSIVSSTGSQAYASTTLAPGSTATFSATPASGYEFIGWSTSNSAGDIVSQEATYKYKYDLGYTGKTVYALFKEKTTAPGAPSSVKLEVLNAYKGTGTQADPYFVEPNKTINTKITCVASDAANTTGFLYNVNYTAAWAKGDAGATEFLYDGLATLANGASGEYTPYAWAYNGTESNRSEMITGTKIYIKAANKNVMATFKDFDDKVLDEVDVKYGGTPTAPADPTRTGYTFLGWNTNKDATTGTKTMSAITKNTTYYAIYQINSYDFSMSCEAPADSTWGTISAKTSDGTALTSGGKVNYEKVITVSATPKADYNFVGWTIVNNGETTTSSESSTTITVKGNVTVTAEFVAKEYHKITYSANVEPGSFSVTGNTVTTLEEGKSYQIEAGNAFEVTVVAPDGYYIKSINTTNYDETKVSIPVKYNATYSLEDQELLIEFAVRPTYLVTVVNNDENMGSLDATTKTDLYMNAEFIIKPTAKVGFQFKGWEVVGPSTYVVAADGTITITVKGTETNKETTVTAKWEKKTNFTVTLKAPASMGWASGSGTDANLGDISLDTKANTATLNSAEVYAGTVLTFTANTWDDTYVFDKWDIQGNYTNATQNGSTLTLTANGEVTVTALYKQGSYKFYVLKASPYTNVYVKVNYYTYNWTKLTDTKVIDGNTYLVGTMAANTDWIQFASDGNGSNFWQIRNANGSLASVGNSMNLASSNKDNNNSYKGWGWITAGSTNAPITYELTGGVSLKLEDYGDGNHIGSVEIPSGKTSITVNPYGSDKKYWNFASTIDDNSANVTQGSATKGTAVTINLGSNSYGVKVDFSFNPVTMKLSWTVTQMKATVNITVNYGMNQNEADPHDGQDIAKTYYKVDGEIIYSFTEGNGHVAKIAEGEMVTVYTEIYASAYQNGKPIHRVEGWVLDGVEFIPASSNDGKTFYGTYKYTKDAEITPIFFHTDEWLTANNVSTVTVYAVLDTKDDTTPNHEIKEWQKGISSYTWFYKSGETTSKYCQFDTWTGQYMIPVGNHVFKTYIETKGASGSAYTGKDFYGLDISGITFTNVMKDTINTDDWVQAYDYYEFKSLIDDGRFNITYVLRNHNTKVNKDKKPGATISTTNYQWMNYIDYSGNIMDIYRNVTKSKSTTTPDNTLYIVREGPYNITGSADRNGNEARGEFYLYSNIYDASGKKIDRCLTYELVDPESEFFKILKNKEAEIQQTHPEFTYVGGNVQISYEAENNKKYDGTLQATRYDGEWYGDLTDTTKVDINVLVGFSDKTITVLDTNANIYGTATVNGKAEDEVTRGSYATLLASEKPGYKFIGWYNSKKDGDKIVTTTLLTEGYTMDVEASVAATYVAVYRVRTGGEFDVLNLKYAGDTSDPSVPFAHGGESYRYVKVIHEHKNGQTFTKTYDKKADGWSVPDVSEGDKLTITIYTDAFYPEDYFYAWYMEVRDSAGKIVNFEEVGVDKSHVGSKEEVSFTFEYIVKQNDNGITIYSDVYHKEITKDIIYLYQDRYNNTKQYIKSKYTLVDKELITGVPSEETIIKFAPWVEDLYKDTQWIFAEDKFTEDSWTLVATQAPTEYTVRVFTNPVNITPIKGVYDTPVEVYATEIDPEATNNGWWYEDCGTVSGSYDDGDKILAYGTYYGLLIKRNVDIGYYYKPELELNFNVALDAPIYGREQSGVDGAIDKIFVDYHTSIHVPYFNGDELKNGEVITDVYYEGETFVSANSPVTLETLEEFGYKVEYGIITEQVGTFKIGSDGTYDDYTSAEADAKKEGFMTATDESLLAKVVGNKLTKGWGKEFGLGGPKMGTSDEYYTVYALTDKDFISNKNRFPFTLIFNNTTANRGRFYNVYGYIAVTYTPEGSKTPVTEYYFSNMETLNFHEAGTNTSDAYKK